ncbi:hypothetical protein D915_005098 [Fasciola hepatica]|uniref:Saposin B-type domain-containing protein n=1 Tax=Fasciola hepatica TaxID=6192 RepID=A0A4E0RS57_FASHE|nr:hypothetical protein D915_005098 [Fasciola hepatica]
MRSLMLTVVFLLVFMTRLSKEYLVIDGEMVVSRLSNTDSPQCSAIACNLCEIILNILQPLALSPAVDNFANQLIKRVCDVEGKTKRERFMCWVIMYDTVKTVLKLLHDMNPREACGNTTLCATQPSDPMSFISSGVSLEKKQHLISQHLNCFALGQLFNSPGGTIVKREELTLALVGEPVNRRDFRI